MWEQSPLTAPTAHAWSHDVRLTVERGARRLTLEQASVRADSVAGVVVEAHVGAATIGSATPPS